jgi:DNA-binding GntR family transcriptional regulator
MAEDVVGLVAPLTHAPVLRDRVYERLEELIISRVLAPGQRLVESELARQLGVSRNPVREALTLLHRAGWVDVRARRGAHVHEPTAKEVRDFFHVRSLLEVGSARLAAGSRANSDLTSLHFAYESGLAAVASGDIPRMAAANSVFHWQIADIAGNTVLSELSRMLEKRLRWYIGQVARERGEESWREHQLVLEAIEAGNADEAGSMMTKHCEATTRVYLDSR